MNKVKTENLNPFYLGHLEMNRWQDLINLNHQENLTALFKDYGLIIKQNDTLFYADNWKVGLLTPNKISVNAGTALLKDENGKIAFISAPNTSIDIPTTNATYKLLLRSKITSKEKGTVSILDSTKNAVGINTEFTKLFGANRRIIINDTPYIIASVQDDTHLTLETEQHDGNITDQEFYCGGWFPTYPSGITDNYIYEYGSYEFVLKTSAKLDHEYWIAEILVSGGIITVVTDKRSLSLFKTNLNVPDIDGTPASTFKVGGRYVELEEDTPPPVKNIKIVDIFANSLQPDSSMQGKITQKGIAGNSNQLNVSLEWGYNNITGNGGINVFNINTAGLTFSANELQGYFLYIPTIEVNLKILSNLATSAGNTALTVEREGGADWDGSGVSVTSLNPASIHHNADRYELVFTPQIKGTAPVVYQYTPEQNIVVPLNIGSAYFVKIRAIKGKSYNEYVIMPAGSFIKYSVVQNYGSPFIVKHPEISSTGVSILAQSSDAGFICDIINGWTEANEIEIVYATDASKATFNETSGNTKETFLRPHFEKITSISRRYYLRVRPIIAGQAVADQYPVTDPLTLVSGVQGPQNQQVIAQPYIQHRTYSGNIAITDAGTIGELSSVKSPASSTQSVTGINNLEGSIITINSNDYMITATIGGLFIVIEPIGSSPILSNGNYSFTIGVSKRARRKLRSNNYPINYRIQRIDVDSDVKRGEDITLRVYQESNEGAADSIIISASETGYSKDVDILLSGTYGQRTLIIDLWDPATIGAKNKGELSGLVTVYAIPAGSGVGDPVSTDQ